MPTLRFLLALSTLLTLALSASPPRLFSPSALVPGKHVAIAGRVFDVSPSPVFYGGPDPAPSFFRKVFRRAVAAAAGDYFNLTGRDASRAFATGDFEGDLVPGVVDLGPEACLDVWGWLGFYKRAEKYEELGKVVGWYYDEKGEKTEKWREWVDCYKKSKKYKQEEDDEAEDEAEKAEL